MTQQEVIKKFMESLDKTKKKGEAALDEAIQACSTFSGFQALKNSMVRNCRIVNDSGKGGDYFLKNYCGIDLDNEDTGAITGSDAGGATVKDEASIVHEDGSLIKFSDNSFEVNGLTVKLGKRKGSRAKMGSITERSFDDLSEKEIYLWRSFYTWWVKKSLELIAESYGDNFGFDENSSASTKTLYIIFEDSGGDDGELASTWGGPAYSKKSTSDINFYVNMYYYDKTYGRDGYVTSEVTDALLDRTIAHELTHAVMRANINYFDYLPALIKEGAAELVHGIDDYRTWDIENLANNSKLLSKALSSDKKPVSVYGIGSPSYSGGYMMLRYLARQAGDLTIKNSSNSTAVKTFRGNDSIKNYGRNATVESGDGDDSIKNNSSRVSINAGADNDSIYSAGDNVTVIGFKGNDSVKNDGGSYVTIDGGEGNDFIQNYNESFKVSINGNAGNDILQNKSGKNVTLIGGAGKDSITNFGSYTTIDGGSGNDSIDNDGFNVTISGGEGNDYIYNEGDEVTIAGGAGNDTIYSKGEYVTISGGIGNDKIINDGGKNTTYRFGKGDGKDTVVGFNTNDTIKITSGTYSAEKSGNNVVVTVENDILTLKDAVGKKINFISETGKKTTKTYSASAKKSSAKVSAKVPSLWFADDDNFATSDNLSSIVKSKDISSSYSELESSSSLTKKNNIVTYSGSKK